jgi:phospholipase/carboxylesterase
VLLTGSETDEAATMPRIIECGAEVADAALAAIMIHGRGRGAGEMAALADTLAVDGIRYYCPEAPGRSWYPARFVDPLEANQPALGKSLAAIEALLANLHAAGFADERIVLGGFSQGGCLAAQTLLRRPSSYAAALLFTGGLIGPPGTVWRSPGQLFAVPVLLTGSETDEWVPAWRSRETDAVLSGLGAELETVIYPSRDHIVGDDEVLRGRALLERVVATRASALSRS